MEILKDKAKKIIVTTSWDDGHQLDLRLLALLNKYKLKGTFYIPQKINYLIAKNKPFTQLNQEQIQEISRFQEVAAHTLNHVYLCQIPLIEAEKEIKGSKEWLEDIIGQPVKMFSYPRGVFNDEIVDMVSKSGFLGARTTQPFSIDLKDRFLMGTTLQVYPHFLNNQEWSIFFRTKLAGRRFFLNLKGVLGLGLPINSFFSWSHLAENLFNHTRKKGGIWHLWGHSWEIERYHLWDDLEEIFEYLSNQEGILYLTNSQVIEELNP